MGLPIDELHTDGLSNHVTLFAIIYCTYRHTEIIFDLKHSNDFQNFGTNQGVAQDGRKWNGNALRTDSTLHTSERCEPHASSGVLEALKL